MTHHTVPTKNVRAFPPKKRKAPTTTTRTSKFLITAYEKALDKLRVGVCWLDLCHEAALEMNKIRITKTKTGKTVGDWHRHFRMDDKFPHPNAHVKMGKKPKPALFEIFHLEARMKEFVVEHLD